MLRMASPLYRSLGPCCGAYLEDSLLVVLIDPASYSSLFSCAAHTSAQKVIIILLCTSTTSSGTTNTQAPILRAHEIRYLAFSRWSSFASLL
jgi:hypothetical protein